MKRPRVVVLVACLAVLPLQNSAAEGPLPDGCDDERPPRPLVWGIAGLRGYAFGQQTAPNGLEYKPLFSMDLTFNCWLWEAERVYLSADSRFWGQRPSPGVTNASQGIFDFSKRELDLNLGAAWNYHGPWEARAFAYAFNNLNRGSSLSRPSGYADGCGLENRYYLGPAYAELGTQYFDVARASFVSLGFMPTKHLIGEEGQPFKPGPFARAYLTWDLLPERYYLFADAELIGTQSFVPKLLRLDVGLAVRPFPQAPRFELRLGTAGQCDLQVREAEWGLYLEARLVF